MQKENLTTFKQEHPSFGVISFGKVSGSDRCFGASGYYGQLIRMTVSTATLEKSHDSYDTTIYPLRQVIEVEMTPLQFATAISVIGGDVPCSIVWRDGKKIPTIPEIATRRELIEQDFRRHQELLAAECDQFVEEAKALQAKASIGKADRERFVKLAESLRAQIKNHQPHIASKFADLVQDMLAEVEIAKHHDNK
jgi:hypothetical protein